MKKFLLFASALCCFLFVNACSNHSGNTQEYLVKSITSIENVLNKGYARSQICNLYLVNEFSEFDPEISTDSEKSNAISTFILSISNNIDNILPDISADLDNLDDSLPSYIDNTKQNTNIKQIKSIYEDILKSSNLLYEDFEGFTDNSDYTNLCHNLTLTINQLNNLYINLQLAYKLETGKDWEPAGFNINETATAESETDDATMIEIEQVEFDSANEDFSTVISSPHKSKRP